MENELRNSQNFFEMKEQFVIRDFERKKELAQMRFDLAVKLAVMMDKMAIGRHKERCEILGIKYIEPQREKLIMNRVEVLQHKKWSGIKLMIVVSSVAQQIISMRQKDCVLLVIKKNIIKDLK